MIEIEIGVSLFNNLLVSLLEIFWEYHISVLSYGLHACFLSDWWNISSTDLLRTRHIIFQINFLTQVHFVCKSRENESFLTSVRQWEFNFPIESTWSQKSWIKSISSIGGHNTFDVNVLIETIHLLEKLNQNSLNFSICTGICIKSFCSNSIDLINENNRGSIFLCHSEHISNHTRAFTEIFLYKLRTNHSDNRSICLVCNSFCKHCFTGTWRSVKKHTSRRVNTDLRIQLWVSKRELDSFLDLLLLNVHTANISVSDIWSFGHLHHLDRGISVCWENIDYWLRWSMECNSSIWFQIFSVQGW